MNTIEFGRFRLQTGLRFEATQLNTRGYIVTNDANGNYISTAPALASNWYWIAAQRAVALSHHRRL